MEALLVYKSNKMWHSEDTVCLEDLNCVKCATIVSCLAHMTEDALCLFWHMTIS